MTYQEELEALAAQAGEQGALAMAEYERGTLTADELAAMLLFLILTSQGKAVTLTHAFANYLAGNTATPPAAALAAFDTPREEAVTRKAVATVLADLDADDIAATKARVERLARGKVSESAGAAMDTAISSEPSVTGWRRGLEATACELCRWLAEGGKTFPASLPMKRHTGCLCVPIPTKENA